MVVPGYPSAPVVYETNVQQSHAMLRVRTAVKEISFARDVVVTADAAAAAVAVRTYALVPVLA